MKQRVIHGVNDYKIYCYTNKITGQKYVGQTCQSLEERAGRNGKEYQGKFLDAIMKYGWDNFSVEILEDNLTVNQVDSREKYWIRYLNTIHPYGYNSNSGGSHTYYSPATLQYRPSRYFDELYRKGAPWGEIVSGLLEEVNRYLEAKGFPNALGIQQK